jgi:hypothetical protein
MRILLSTAAAAVLASGLGTSAATAQAPAPTAAPAPEAKPRGPAEAALALEPGEGRAIAAKLGDELIKSFVFRDQAEAYAAMLKKNAEAGRYDRGTRGQLAKLMTDDLMAVHKDGHLHLEVASAEREAAGGNRPPPGMPPLIQAAKTIAPGIGYIRFTAFAGKDEEVAAVRKWLAENRNAKTLIFDLRNHHGGGLKEQDAIFASIFGRETPLVTMALAKSVYDGRGSMFGNVPTLKFEQQGDKMVATHMAMPGEATPLRKAKVYLLVSNKTASAAEHFSLAMKSTGRGTLIGEATAGANHFGGPVELNDHCNVWMPVGRTYDVKTGKDWEGDGVAPDIAVDPKLALVTALEKAGVRHDEAVRLDAQEVPAEPVHSDKLRAR